MKKIFTILGVAVLGTTAFSQELLTNPGFEAGLAPWAAGTTSSYTAPAIVTGAAHGGTQYAEYAGVTATTGFFQNVPITEGNTYVISFWYKSSGDDTDSRLWSVYKNAANQAVYTTANADTDAFRTNNGYLPTATEWTLYTAEMPAGPAAVSLDVAVRAYNNAVSVQFDDFSLMNKASMSVVNVKDFDTQVKMNTVVGNELKLVLPAKSTVNIYSVDGKLVSSNRVENGQSVNTSSLVKGAYIVTVDNGTAKISRKIIKK